MKHRQFACCIALFLLAGSGDVRAELITIEVHRREAFAGGMSFGDVGPYERIEGVARFAVDPSHPRNRLIVDLSLAPRNADGKVVFASDFYILTPKDQSKGNGAIFYDVNNRGNKLAVKFFNGGPGGNEPNKPADAGDGFLFRRGYTITWSGWNGEILHGQGRLLLQPPIAGEPDKPIRGIVRCEMMADKPTDTLPLPGREAHGSYAPSPRGEAEGKLTYRLRETDDRMEIPRAKWRLQRPPLPASRGNGVVATLNLLRLQLDGGFQPGYLYELIYEAEGPIVQGVGYAAVRDLVSFLRHDASTQNPVRTADGKPALGRAHAFGVSQSGRFLRNFLYLGFNADESDRKVFDGVISHVAGGGLGFFNHRFAQPTRANGQHQEHLYPTDYFPFTYGDSIDPFSKRTDGILHRTRAENVELLPKVMHTQSAAEYWHRSGSLVHTDPLGTKDEVIPENVRIYAFGGTQHGPAGDPPGRGNADNLHNPGDYRPFLKALLDAMDVWVRQGTSPPPSVYPRIDQGTLVSFSQESTGFPTIPKVRYPTVIQSPHALDLGPEFESRGIITVEPPRIRGNYVVLVPKCGADGNELGTLLPPEVAVPLATYTGWNLRRREAGADGSMANLLGSYIPFPRTRADRQAAGDPRESVQERYGSYEDYRRSFVQVCDDRVARKYVLKEDAERLAAGREKYRELWK